jgi:hypothetical protein
MDISPSNLDRETEIDDDAGIFEIPTQSWQESNYFFNHLNGTIFIYEDDKFEREITTKQIIARKEVHIIIKIIAFSSGNILNYLLWHSCKILF